MPSEKVLNEKKLVVADLTEKLKKAKAAVLVDYLGLTVEQDTALRIEFRKENVDYLVAKNTMLSFAVDNAGLSDLKPYLKGPTAIAISYDDLVAPARVVAANAKKYEVMGIKIGILEGEIIDVDQVKALADLPTKDVLISIVLGTMNAPIRGLATVLNGTIRALAIALNAVAEQKAS
jgi:large subunit ribosomal protein L10